MTPNTDKYEEVVNSIEFDLNRTNKHEVLQLLRRDAEKCDGCHNSAIWNILASLTCDSAEFDWHIDDFINDKLQESILKKDNGRRYADSECDFEDDNRETSAKKYIIYFCVAGAAFAIGYWIGRKHFKPPPASTPQFPSYLDFHPYVNVLKKLWIF
uniref:Uncharacterized protein n=1 Tax=Panagrolaimus superbus TaxID=310955 RepID=A0A914XSM8_9BILA